MDLIKHNLNTLLGKEAEKYESYANCQGYHFGHYKRDISITEGEVKLKIPKLKGLSFETAIIESFCSKKSSVEEVIIEMCLVGVSV